jgi:hypothetical protein
MEDTRRETKLRYDWVDDFCEERAIVRLDKKYGYVDLDCKVVVPLLYDWVNNFSEGRARVRLDYKWGVIDLDGNEVMPCWYTFISEQPYGFFASFRVSTRDVENHYFDRDGNLIAEPITN